LLLHIWRRGWDSNPRGETQMNLNSRNPYISLLAIKEFAKAQLSAAVRYVHLLFSSWLRDKINHLLTQQCKQTSKENTLIKPTKILYATSYFSCSRLIITKCS